MKIAVIGGGSAGYLAAAHVSKMAPEHELCHIYDSRIPTIGVGEGTFNSLAPYLRELTGLDDATVQRRLQATRKYGIHYRGWGRANRDFIHHFWPAGQSYGYHLSTDRLVELLRDSIRARRVDARVRAVTRIDGGTRVSFDDRAAERFDFVMDARGFPRRLDPQKHIRISFIPTNTAIVRRGPPTAADPDHTYTGAIARPHGWIFVIPLAGHTSYGYVFNRRITSVGETERDFDEFMSERQVPEFEPRGVIRFHNFIHRRTYDGFLARVGNAGGFMEPLEATALNMTQAQIAWIVKHRLSKLVERGRGYAALVNLALIARAWRLGVFISWHYSRGATYDTAFWKYAREQAWPPALYARPGSRHQCRRRIAALPRTGRSRGWQAWRRDGARCDERSTRGFYSHELLQHGWRPRLHRR